MSELQCPCINLFRQHITGARQFERLLSKQSDEEQLFGRVDLASLLPGSVPPTVLEQDATYQNQRFNLRVLVEGIGSMKDEPATWEKLKSGTEKLELYRAALSALHKSEPTVQTAGKIPEADIVLLDEIFKCNDGVLNSLLTALNERKYTNEGRTYPIPVISFFAASNEIPNFNDPQEKILEALYDRLELKVVTANMEDRDTRLAVLKNKQAGTFGQVTVTITLEELRQMQQEVASILVPDAINELADDILCELRKDMTVSDRKYLGYIKENVFSCARMALCCAGAFIYPPPASGHGGQRLQGAGGLLFSIPIRTHQPPFEMEDNYDDYQPETVLPLYDRKRDAGSFGRDRRRPLDGRPPVRQLQAAEAQKWRVLAGHRSRL